MAKGTPPNPRHTVKLMADCMDECLWCPTTVDGKPAMHAVCRCNAVNIIENPIYLLKAYIDKPLIEGDIVVKHYELDRFSSYPVFPDRTAQVAIHFFIQPPLCEEGEKFKANVAIVDMYGNEHKMSGVIFAPLNPEPEKLKLSQGESVADIANPVERRVVEALKAEMCKYETCGKKAGGLGTVITRYKNKVLLGVGSDIRTLSAPDEQPIISEPHNARIESDIAEMLIVYYENLAKQEDWDVFKNALLKRLNRNCDYNVIGYFIVLVLMKIGEFSAALQTAKKDLQGDSEYGFSNVLMLLDGLLKYNHDILREDQLDEIEALARDTKGHTFRISERIAVIRGRRTIT